jgi:flagellar motor switch protein FliN/FliY
MAEEENNPEEAFGSLGEIESEEETAEESFSSPEIRAAEFGAFEPTAPSGDLNSLELIMDVHLGATVELGRSRLSVREVLALGPGSVVELDKLAGEPADLLINGKLLARGEIVVIDENFGIRITEIVLPRDRIQSLR